VADRFVGMLPTRHSLVPIVRPPPAKGTRLESGRTALPGGFDGRPPGAHAVATRPHARWSGAAVLTTAFDLTPRGTLEGDEALR
jgi:hypothetical protein